MGCGPSSIAGNRSNRGAMTNSAANKPQYDAGCEANAPKVEGHAAAATSNATTTEAMAAPASSSAPASSQPVPGRHRRPLVRVLSRPMGNLRAKYHLGREVGRGQFGVTRECTEIATGRMLACKSIAKTKLLQREDIDDCRREVEVMLHLSGHPNIVCLVDVIEDATHVHLVQEMCRGGELFDRIVERSNESSSPYTEFEAAAIVRTVLGALHHCHSLGVFHRDLKPENFLLAKPNDEQTLKITDFGLSVFFKEGQNFTDIVGSSFYVAPEVLNKSYGASADLWSLGVILYILLCGQPPFWGDTEEMIFRSVVRCNYDLVSPPWPQISDGAKDAVRRLLHPDPRLRPTAEKMLRHPWVAEGGTASKAPLGSLVVDRLRKFATSNKFKKQALKMIAQGLSKTELEGLKHMFERMDTDNSGTITVESIEQSNHIKFRKNYSRGMPVREKNGVHSSEVDEDALLSQEQQ